MAQPYNQNFPECWFSRLLARKGEDYISSGKLTDNEVLRNIDRIIDDIINGRIDYSKYGNCILNSTVFDNLLSYCRSKLSIKSAELYCLSYTNWAIETGNVVIANNNHFVNGEFYDPNTMQPPYNYDANVWNSGHCTITPTTRNDINTALREITTDYNKFNVLTNVLNSIQSSQNIYELQWATNLLKQFIRSNNKLVY